MDPMNKNDILSAYRQDLELQGMAPDTIRIYPNYVGLFQDWLKNKSLEDAGRADFKDYIAYLRAEDLKVKSIRLYFSALNSFYNFLMEEGLIGSNPVQGIAKRYLRQYKDPATERRALTVQEAQKLLSAILDIRDRAIILMLLKTGIRLHELIDLDLEDIDLDRGIFRLKESPKVTNRVRFMDEELTRAVKRWLPIRDKINRKEDPALWLSNYKKRISKPEIYVKFKSYARAVNLEGISPHNCRHSFTTWLLSSGMPREYVQILRGDIGKEAIDIYNHPSQKQLQENYLAHIPRLGI